jgi:cytosolic carboxypeptidase protein 2/3
LKDNIELRLIPMLNPDGVVIGNYRTGIMGEDLNRRFDATRSELYPEVAALKRVIANCKREGGLELFLDLHGHSVLKNSFIYGPAENDSSSFRSNYINYAVKNLAYHLFHNSKYFRLASCKFGHDLQKAQTARLYFQHQ